MLSEVSRKNDGHDEQDELVVQELVVQLACKELPGLNSKIFSSSPNSEKGSMSATR